MNKPKQDMLSVAEALAIVTAGVSLVSAEQVPLPAALGRVLAEDVAARLSHPPADVSAMDGYAVAAAQAGGLYRYNADFLQPKVPFSEGLAVPSALASISSRSDPETTQTRLAPGWASKAT